MLLDITFIYLVNYLYLIYVFKEINENYNIFYKKHTMQIAILIIILSTIYGLRDYYGENGADKDRNDLSNIPTRMAEIETASKHDASLVPARHTPGREYLRWLFS